MPGNPQSYTLGLDLGIASVGWAVLADDHIIDLGVRAFDKAETAKEGDSLNLVRRTARLLRRRLHRRSGRLGRLAGLLHQNGLIPDAAFFKKQTPTLISPWQLRVEGLDRVLGNEEWARVLYHLCKHRGFHWISRADRLKEESDSASESGKVKKGLAETNRLMSEKGYRTAAEMILQEFPEAQRNKQGDYSKALSRILLADELKQLFEAQRRHGNKKANHELETAILGNGDQKSGLFWEQKPPLSGDNLLKMLGNCTFEKQEKRAPKASFSAERHVWLTQLNNLRIHQNGEIRDLTDAERSIALPLPYQKAKITYKQLRDVLVKNKLLEDDFTFTRLTYTPSKDGKEKNPESTTLMELKGWNEIRKVLEKAELSDEWKALSEPAIAEGKSELLDQIAWALSVFKEDDEAEAALNKLNLPGNKSALIDALLYIRFDKFSNLSLKALRNILPHMAEGLRYDEACEKAGYHHSLPREKQKQTKLPSLYKGRDPNKNTMLWNDDMDVPRNPVVLRAINQARKVVNALIDEYGAPQAVHIEMSRDLSRPLNERNKIKKAQEQYRDLNEKSREQFEEQFGYAPSGRELEKYLLYKEQQGKCAYSLKPLDLNRVINEDKYVEVDHALPYSRSYDNGKNNKVLVLTAENQKKGNRTPYEYLDGKNDGPQWQQFQAFVESNKAYRQAKRSRLLRKHFGEDEAKGFRERNLNDTRYIGRFFKNYIEQYLQLADGSENRRCVVLNGQLTAFLRARWGLLKIRDESDRHHALDAVVTAACSHSMVKRLADYSKRKELEYARDGLIDYETGEVVNPASLERLEQHFPSPWPHFRDEVHHRLHIDSPKLLREELEKYGTYSPVELEQIRPLFVSRAPQRRNSGAAHKETIYAQPERLKEQGGVTQKVALSSLSLADLGTPGKEEETCKLADWHRNKKLYNAIRKRLEDYGGKGDKAFAAENPFFKPDKNGNPTGPIVRTVTKVIDKQSGIPVRGGSAKNDTMLRVDVFTKGGKFHLVPVYVHHKVKGLPNRAIVAFKDEEEWTEMDDSFEFLFSLYPNDFVEITLKKGITTGYYASCHRGTGALKLWAHDRNNAVGKNGAIEGIGVKTALTLRKFHVDVLGRRYPAPPETRQPL
jgi:CRISPR-associated endonuclease Csn1